MHFVISFLNVSLCFDCRRRGGFGFAHQTKQQQHKSDIIKENKSFNP
jgi:hypothetical protein